MWINTFISNCFLFFQKKTTFLYVLLESCATYIKNRILGDKQHYASIHKIDKNLYELTYNIHSKTYKILLRPKRGPTPVNQVNKNGKDVTHHVLPYLGPEYNYHGSSLKPEDLGHDSLTFHLSDGTEHTFSGEQVLLKIFLSETSNKENNAI